METLLQMMGALVFVTALSLDGFVASFAYGTDRIRIPLRSALIIDAVCTFMLAVSLALGSVVRNYIPGFALKYICFAILFFLGLWKCFDECIKSIIRGRNRDSFLLGVYTDPESADADRSKTLSAKESVSIAFALSLDGLAAGFGAALVELNVALVVSMALLVNFVSVLAGTGLGNRIAKKIPLNLSWLSGIVLILLAVSKL